MISPPEREDVMPRCESTHDLHPSSTLFGPTLGEALDSEMVTVQCQLVDGHPEKHQALVRPFPGFADQLVTWGDPLPATHAVIAMLGVTDDGHTKEVSIECSSLRDCLIKIAALDHLSEVWSAITIVHIEDMLPVLDGTTQGWPDDEKPG